MATIAKLGPQLLGCRQLLFEHLSGSCFNIHVYNASGATISCTLHYFFSFIHFCSLYSHSGMAVVQKCWKYNTQIFQNRIKMEIDVSMWQTCHFHRPAHRQDLVNLTPLDLDHPYLDSQIFHISRRQFHILGIRRITWSRVLALTHISGWTCEPYCYLVISAQCMWIDTHFCT